MKGFYFASKVKHAPRWLRLREEGVPIISTWIDEAGEGKTADYEELSVRCVDEVQNALAVILYCEPGEIQKGANVEVGIALSSKVPVYCIGTCETLSRVFMRHPLWHSSPSIEAALSAAGSNYGTN